MPEPSARRLLPMRCLPATKMRISDGSARRVIASGLLLVLWAISMPPSEAAGALTAVDDRGVRLRLTTPPRRIVSLSPSLTETLFAIGAGSRIVGVTTYCDYPPAARKIAKIGDYNTSVEKVVALRPDLIVAGAKANRLAIQALGRVHDIDKALFAVEPENLTELYDAIHRLGAITGCVEGSRRTVAHMKRVVRSAGRLRKSSSPRPRVVFVLQRDPIWVAGSGTFVDDMIRAAGGVNLGRSAGKGYVPLSLERLIALNPEVILSTHSTTRDLKRRSGWSRLSAIRNGRVYKLGFEAVRPAPRLADAVASIAKLLHTR